MPRCCPQSIRIFILEHFTVPFLNPLLPLAIECWKKKKKLLVSSHFAQNVCVAPKKELSLFSIRVGGMQSFQKRKESASKKSMRKTVSCLEFLTTESIYCKRGRKFAVPKFIQEI